MKRQRAERQDQHSYLGGDLVIEGTDTKGEERKALTKAERNNLRKAANKTWKFTTRFICYIQFSLLLPPSLFYSFIICSTFSHKHINHKSLLLSHIQPYLLHPYSFTPLSPNSLPSSLSLSHSEKLGVEKIPILVIPCITNNNFLLNYPMKKTGRNSNHPCVPHCQSHFDLAVIVHQSFKMFSHLVYFRMSFVQCEADSWRSMAKLSSTTLSNRFLGAMLFKLSQTLALWQKMKV